MGKDAAGYVAPRRRRPLAPVWVERLSSLVRTGGNTIPPHFSGGLGAARVAAQPPSALPAYNLRSTGVALPRFPRADGLAWPSIDRQRR